MDQIEVDVDCSYNLPWVMSHKRTPTNGVNMFTCEIFDPHTQKAHTISNFMATLIYLYNENLKIYVSNNGWVFLGGESSCFFLHNPFTNAIISIRDLPSRYKCLAATFKSDFVDSCDCVVFVLCKSDDLRLRLCICELYKGREWNTELVGMAGNVHVFGVNYMNGKLYCLFEDGLLKRYDVGDKSWELMTTGFTEPYALFYWQYKCWLIGDREDLIMVRKDFESDVDKWTVFRFDFFKMCWVVETSLKCRAFFLSGDVGWLAPLTDGYGNNVAGCRIFHYDEYDDDDSGCGFKCYSLCAGKWIQVQSEAYDWIKKSASWEMCFIENPYFRPWADLPQGILEIVLNKLNFVDQIHLLAVCKSMRECRDVVKCSNRLPWVISHRVDSWKELEQRRNLLSFTCELFDPYSRKVHKVSNSVEVYHDFYGIHVLVYASKQGWLLLGCERNSFFLYNPFTNIIVSLPDLYSDYDYNGATFKMNPESTDCEISLLYTVHSKYRLSTYRLSKDKDWSTQCLNIYENESHQSMLYLKGNLYCLFKNGLLKCYNSHDESWTLLASEFPEPYPRYAGPYPVCWAYKYWLIENKEDLIMVRLDRKGPKHDIYKWAIFRYNWLEMCWDETSLKNCAIFICENVAWSSPLTDCYGESQEDCKLFFHDVFDITDYGTGFKCYSLNERAGAAIASPEYDWLLRPPPWELSFIEPPYFGV